LATTDFRVVLSRTRLLVLDAALGYLAPRITVRDRYPFNHPPSLFAFVYPIYLDFNSTTPLAPSVLESMQRYFTQHYLLPCQEHAEARAVAESLTGAREQVASLLGCDAFEIVFTGGGTEANNLAILGFALPHQKTRRNCHVIVSALEHESVSATVDSLAGSGWSVTVVSPGSDGIVNPERIEDAITDSTALVCVQAANPVFGTLQPIREIADCCHSRGIALHCDATQLFSKMHVDIADLRADTVAISGHKFYGPKGTGALYVRRGFPLSAVMFGESREMGLRPGAENVPGWVGLGVAAALASRCVDEAEVAMRRLRDHMADAIRELMPSAVVLCEASPRLPNTLAIQLPVDAKSVQRAARELIFAIAQSETPPDEITRCLRAIGKSKADIRKVVRFSIGWTTSRDQIDRAVEILAGAIEV